VTHRAGSLTHRHWRRPLLALFTACVLCTLSAGLPETKQGDSPKPVFKEVWAYLMRGEEKELSGREPITDIGYFGVSLTREGRVTDNVSRPDITLRNGFKPAIHVVVAELSNSSLMHFSLDPRYGVRPLLVEDIRRIAEPFDGVQIDFESVSREDADSFFDFLKELKDKLPAGKKLTVACPARIGLVQDAYDYSRIARIVDQIVIMAYDEHWSTSAPGPVASLSWCSKVADFARSQISSDQIIMGLPLYGRAWQDKRLAKALRFRNVQELVEQTNSQPSRTTDLGASFEYTETVVVKVFYDDEHTIVEKLLLYSAKNIGAVSFWRIGQGPPDLWNRFENANAGGVPAADTGPAAAGTVGERASSRQPYLP
jgi:spore germination protein